MCLQRPFLILFSAGLSEDFFHITSPARDTKNFRRSPSYDQIINTGLGTRYSLLEFSQLSPVFLALDRNTEKISYFFQKSLVYVAYQMSISFAFAIIRFISLVPTISLRNMGKPGARVDRGESEDWSSEECWELVGMPGIRTPLHSVYACNTGYRLWDYAAL